MSEQEPITISYRHPSTIDGNPIDVALDSLDQLDDIARFLGDVLDATGRQVRNAVLEELAVDRDDPAEIASELNVWDAGVHGRRLALLEKVAEELPGLAAQLRKAL